MQNNAQTSVDVNGVNPIPVQNREMPSLWAYVLVFWSTAICVPVIAIGTFMLQEGYNFYQIILIGVVSGLAVAIAASLTSAPGLRYGIPFIIQLRSSFGYAGSKITYLFRIIPAVLWYGISSWIAAEAVDEIMIQLFGVASHVFIYFVLLTIVHVILAYKGIKQIKWFNALVSCAIFVMLIYFFTIIFMENRFDLSTYVSRPWQWGFTFVAAVSTAIANWATVLINNSDMTRQLKTDKIKKGFIGNIFGIFPPWVAMVFFGLFIFVSTGTDDPVAGMMALAPNKTMGIILLLFVILAQISSNLTTSILPAGLAMQSVFHMKWSTSVIISSLLSMFTMPWLLFTADWFFVFQNVYSCFLGPLFGILAVDFWIVNKKSCDIDGLYNEGTGKYRYFKGFSISGFAAIILGAIASAVLLDAAWISGAIVAAAAYYVFKCVIKLDK